jgi:hypothetical protein
MKTIEVSDEMYAKLIELANEMTTQDPRGTRMPHLFQIRDWKKVYDWNLNGNFKIWVDRSHGIEVETFNDLKEYLDNSEISYDEETLKSYWEEKDKYAFDSDLDTWMEENCSELESCSYSMEEVYTNNFLTAKAAENHLKLNDYHYHKDADVYLNHSWRNPEMEMVSTFLCNLIDKELHT